MGQIFRRLKTEEDKEQAEIPVSPEALAELIQLLEGKKLRADLLKKTLESMLDTGKGCMEFLTPEDLAGVSLEQLQEMCRQAIESNPKAAADYRAGKEKALKALLGAVMRQSKGRADAAEAEKMLREQLTAPTAHV